MQGSTTQSQVQFFFCSGRSRTESSQTWEPWRNTRSPPVARSHHQCVVRSNRPEGLRSSAVAKLRDCQEARKSKIASRLGKAILFQATEEGLNSSAPLSAPPLNHAPAVWAQRCGAGGCRREATWILGDLWNVPNAPPRCFIFFIFFAEYWLCKYRETTIHAKQWKIPKVSKVSAVALRGSSRMYPSVSIFFDRPCPIVFSQIVANLNIYHSIRNILWQILNWYDLISIIFNFPFKSPKMVLTISSSLLITGPPRRLARRGRRPRGRQRKMVTFPGSGWGSQSEHCAFGVFFGAWGLVLSPIAVIYNYNIYIYVYLEDTPLIIKPDTMANPRCKTVGLSQQYKCRVDVDSISGRHQIKHCLEHNKYSFPPDKQSPETLDCFFS